ncbi:MAG: FAD-dependent oxidoreductase [Firmicutes bacterium]|nr:FAD-dependent oxidoreductase [Bacillota bacterium]
MLITEEARAIEVLDQVDVLVAGGGIAGCTAAISAADAGASVLLIERNGCLGGVLTSNIIPNLLNNRVSLEFNQLLDGVPRRIIRRLEEKGGCTPGWDQPMAKIVVDEQKLKIVLIELLQEAGVRIYTHVLAAEPIMEGKSVRGLYIETKIGRKAVLAHTVIDCTGEADILSRTGCPMRVTQGTATLAFKMSGFDGEAFYEYFKAHPDEFPKNHDGIRDFRDFEANWKEYGDFYFPHRGGRKFPLVQEAIIRGEYTKSQGKVFGLDMMCLIGLKGLNDLSVNSMLWRLPSLAPADYSEAELETQKICYYIAEFLQTHIPGFEHAHISQISQDLGIRVSRAIEGVETLWIEQVTSEEPVYSDRVIGVRSAKPWVDDGAKDHPFDHDDAGQVQEVSVNGETTKDGNRFLYVHTVDIPFGVLVPQGVENILAGSGKTISCQPQTTMRCGTNSMKPAQGAGVAAAVAAKTDTRVRDVDIHAVQAELHRQGVFLGEAERLRELGLE